MSKLGWLTSFIPFLNQYDVWARIAVFLCFIIATIVLVFAYPKHSQFPEVSSTQETKIDKSIKIKKGDYVKGDKVVGDKIVYYKGDNKEYPAAKEVSPLSYSEIQKAIDKAPPLQRDYVGSKFKGIKVEWDTFFASASNKGNNMVRLLLRVNDSKARYMVGLVRCEVSLDKYPELNILSAETKIKIQGEIEAVDRMGIDLTNVKLFFPAS